MKGTYINRKIVVISPPHDLNREVERVEQLMEAGLEYFHIRKPGFGHRDTERYLKGYSREMRKKMTPHHHYDLADKYKVGGIHITEKNKGGGYETGFHQRRISISCHSTADLLALGGNYAYAFLSPIFQSLSKPDYHPSFRLDELKYFLTENKELPPVIALGGIHPGSLMQIQGLGFNGVGL